jgi:adenylate cyclase
MPLKDLGILTPTGGGDAIPLRKERLLIGRREDCDIILRYPNVSGHHCRLTLENGYWFINDLESRNGVKVDGTRVQRKRLDPGSQLEVARHEYLIEYVPEKLGAVGPPPADDDNAELLLRGGLMDRTGLNRRSKANPDKNKAAGE